MMSYAELERKVKVLPGTAFRGLLFVRLTWPWPKGATPIKVGDVLRATGLQKRQFAQRLQMGEEFIINPKKLKS